MKKTIIAITALAAIASAQEVIKTIKVDSPNRPTTVRVIYKGADGKVSWSDAVSVSSNATEEVKYTESELLLKEEAMRKAGLDTTAVKASIQAINAGSNLIKK